MQFILRFCVLTNLLPLSIRPGLSMDLFVKTDVATPMATVALLRHQSITCQTTQMTRVTFVETISIVAVAMINKHTAMAPICKHNRHHRIF